MKFNGFATKRIDACSIRLLNGINMFSIISNTLCKEILTESFWNLDNVTE